MPRTFEQSPRLSAEDRCRYGRRLVSVKAAMTVTDGDGREKLISAVVIDDHRSLSSSSATTGPFSSNLVSGFLFALALALLADA